MIDRFIRDERGFTTAGMAVALLVALTLLFSTAQVYRINTAAAQIQEVADSCALAAENEVAEFMIAVRVCDGVVLTTTLLGVCAFALGVVCLCVPPAQPLGLKIIEAAHKIIDARNSFARNAAKGLNALQKALPYLAAANAVSVALANGSHDKTTYAAFAVLVPTEGEEIKVGTGKAADELAEAVEKHQKDLEESAKKAEEAAEKANAAKMRGFLRDCGDAPSACMYERAAHLAGLGGGQNPLYHSVDAWSFTVALNRAKAYYRVRLATEAPTGSSVGEQARSALRKRFYAYVVHQLNGAYVHETAEGFQANFPRFPRNTSEMSLTPLFSESVYPITVNEEGLPTMHAFGGCPNAVGFTGYGSVQMLAAGGYVTCSACEFTPSSLGKVAAASTSIPNGFEYHYDAVAVAAQDYEKAKNSVKPLSDAVKNDASSLLDKAIEALKEAGQMRIKATPPGSAGCIVLMAASGGMSHAPGSSFVGGGRTLGARAAVSAATLLADESEEASVVADMLDGFGENAGVAVGAARVLLACWSGLLHAYAEGQQALIEGIREGLCGLPLVSLTGLGDWAADKLEEGLKTCGLEPADLRPLKPVLADTGAVAAGDGGGFAVRYAQVKQTALRATSQGTLYESLASEAEKAVQEKIAQVEITIAEIELPFGGGTMPITLTLPDSVKSGLGGAVESAFSSVVSLVGSVVGDDRWK